MEHRVRKKSGGAPLHRRDASRSLGLQFLKGKSAAETSPDGLDGPIGAGFVERHAQCARRAAGARCKNSEIEALVARPFEDALVADIGVHRRRIEIGAVQNTHPEAAQAGGEDGRASVDTPSDVYQSFGPVIDGIHRSRHRQQHLCGTDVGGRLIAANVLLARLQREPVGRCTVRIDRNAHQATGQAALMSLFHRHIRGMGRRAQRDAEALLDPMAISAPNSPGGFNSVKAKGSAATTAIPPFAWMASIAACSSRTCP